MKLIDRYIIRSIALVASITLLLCTLMLLSVDLFANLDSYLTRNIPYPVIAKLTLLYAPEAVLFALGPSLLFSASFFLSQLQANNEMICLLGSGHSYKRIVIPILLLGIVFSALQFGFSEYVHIPLSKEREAQEDALFGLRSTYDNRNITLRDPEGTYVVHARQYSEKEKRLAQVMLVLIDEKGSLQSRIDAPWAYWEEEKGLWRLEQAREQAIDESSMLVNQTDNPALYVDAFTLHPSYFRNLSNDIKTMELRTAYHYLARIADLDPNRYPELATDFAKRILDSLTPLVMLFIACAISYKYKKNVLLFSIITSLGLAVIYYVVQMVTLIMAKQAVIGPSWGMVIPMIVIVCIALAERAAIR